MTAPTHSHPPTEFEALAQSIRPELHRYCTRMIGSVIDAEDIVQETLAKAFSALPTTAVGNMRAWLFRIAHNKAIDYLRRASQQPLEYLDEQALFIDEGSPLDERELVAIALSVFLKLAPKQRSCVILKDVMGYSLVDISELLSATIPEIKSALHRGRSRLRELAPTIGTERPVPRDKDEHELLARYIDRFNARDFDAVRAMLADEVRLDLVNRTSRRGFVEVSDYFHRYSEVLDWQLTAGVVENRPAILVYDRDLGSEPAYFMLIEWQDNQVSFIRDFRYARYVMRDAEVEE